VNEPSPPSSGSTARPAFLHRELIILIALIVAGVAAFIGTRNLAASNVAIRRQNAVDLYNRGRNALDAGDTARALEALRRASHIDRSDRDIAISLGLALQAAGDNGQATTVMEQLRAVHPDDPEVNTQLARLAAARGDLPQSIRYYQDALDALWSPADASRGREVRTEFITLLIRHQERARALSQALVFAADLPPEPSWQMQAGRLFLEVGDSRRALDRFVSVLQQNPGDKAALAGAGEAAFGLGDYARARRYFTQAEPTEPRAQALKAVADLVLSADPLAIRLNRSERERRLQQLLTHAGERLDRCTANGSAAGSDPALRAQLDALSVAPTGRARALADERERIEDGLDLARRIELTTATCGDTDALGRAIPIIATQHGLEEQR
jgi:tetratricopeptide (TPR) repeat protein